MVLLLELGVVIPVGNLKNSISITFLGNLAFAISQWLIISFVVRIGPLKDVGMYALALSIVSPIFSFFSMNLMSIQATDVKNQYSFKEYLLFKVVTSIGAVFCVVIVLLVIALDIYSSFLILAYSLVKVVESFNELSYGQYQKKERMDLVARSLLWRSLLGSSLFCFIYYSTLELIYSVIGLSFAWSVVAIFVDGKASVPKDDTNSGHAKGSKAILSILLTAIPLGFVVFCNTINLNVPRYFVTYYMNEEMLGVYAAVSYFIIAGAILINAAGQSATARLAMLYLYNKKQFICLLNKLILFALGVGVLGNIFSYYLGGIVLTLFYSKQFESYAWLLNFVMFSGIFVYTSAMVGSGLTAMRRFTIQAYLASMVVVVIFITAWLTVPRFGLTGAALSVAVGYGFKLFIAYTILYMEVSRSDIKS